MGEPPSDSTWSYRLLISAHGLPAQQTSTQQILGVIRRCRLLGKRQMDACCRAVKHTPVKQPACRSPSVPHTLKSRALEYMQYGTWLISTHWFE